MASCSVSPFKKYFIVFLVWSTYFTVTGDIVVNPRDTEASVGEAIELVCTSTVSAIDWHHLRAGAKIHEIVYKDGYVYNEYKGRFNAIDCSSAGGKCTLVIQNVSLADAGTYICMETSEEAVQKAAELIVYEHFPSPQSCLTRVTCSPECNNMELSCNMKYNGNIKAVMEWRNFTGELVPSTSFVINGTTTSTIGLNKHQFQSASYVCQVKYSLDNMGSRYNWTHKYQDPLLLNPAQDTENQKVTVFITILVAVIIVSLIIVSSLIGIIIWICKSKRNSFRRHTFNRNDPLRLGVAMFDLRENHWTENDPLQLEAVRKFALQRTPSASIGYNSKYSSVCPFEVIEDNQTSGSKLFEHVGADGTIYMEMSKEQPQQVSSNLRKPNYPPMFEKSVYASIDHSLAPPLLSTK